MNVIHIAWLGERNFGDELMAQAIWDRLDGLSPDGSYRIWSVAPPMPHDRVRWIYPFRTGSRTIDAIWEDRASKDADALVIGGGSILHSAASSDWKRAAVERFKRAHPDRKAVGIGLSVGPFDGAEDEKACGRFLKTLDACAFRDRQSHALASSLDLPYAPVRAFDLAACHLARHGFGPRQDVVSIETVGLSVRLPYQSDPERTLARYVELAKALCERFKTVKLFSFTGAGSQCDRGYCRRIAKAALAANLEQVRYDGDLAAFIAEMKACDFFISTKFHGIVVPYLLNVPFISLSYQRKFEDFSDDVGLPERFRFRQGDFDPQDVVSRIAPYALGGRAEAVAAAEKNFAVFDGISRV